MHRFQASKALVRKSQSNRLVVEVSYWLLYRERILSSMTMIGLAAGPESQIPPHLLPDNPDQYVMNTFFPSIRVPNPTPRLYTPDVIYVSLHLLLYSMSS